MRTRWAALVGIALGVGLLVINTPEAAAQKGWGKGGWGGYNPGWGYGGYGGGYGGWGGHYPGYGGYYPGYGGSGISFGGSGWGITIGSGSGYYNNPYYSSYYPSYGYSYPSYSGYSYSQPYYSYAQPYYGGYSTPYYQTPSYQSSYYTPGQSYQPSYNQQPTGPVEEVGMYDGYFKPNNLKIKVGTTVRFTNHGEKQHNVAQPEFNWKTQNLSKGQTYTWTFAEPGTYDLICGIHPEMKVTITVEK